MAKKKNLPEEALVVVSVSELLERGPKSTINLKSLGATVSIVGALVAGAVTASEYFLSQQQFRADIAKSAVEMKDPIQRLRMFQYISGEPLEGESKEGHWSSRWLERDRFAGWAKTRLTAVEENRKMGQRLLACRKLGTLLAALENAATDAGVQYPDEASRSEAAEQRAEAEKQIPVVRKMLEGSMARIRNTTPPSAWENIGWTRNQVESLSAKNQFALLCLEEPIQLGGGKGPPEGEVD